jgi:hypothetical protein
MQNTEVFPNMVLQMVAIGEEAGSLDGMLSKVADFFESEVDDAVEALSSLMEPIIMVVLAMISDLSVGAMFLGGAGGSAAAAAAWTWGGWSAVAVLGGGLAAIATLLQISGFRKR